MPGDASAEPPADSKPARRGRPTSVGLGDRRRAQLTAAAYEVFVEYSYEEASVSAIAKRAGVGQGTLYRYVDGKRELLDMVVDWCVERLMEAIAPEELLVAVESSDPTAVRAVIEGLGARLYGLVDEYPGLLRILTVQIGAVDREFRYRVLGLYNTFDAMIRRMLDAAVERGWLAADETGLAVLARILPALALPGLVLVLDGETEDTPAKRQEFVDAAADLERHGLLRKGPAHV